MIETNPMKHQHYLEEYINKMSRIVYFNKESDSFVIKRIDLSKIEISDLTIEKIEAEDSTYSIPMARCDTPAKMIGWFLHLCEKGWMSKEVLVFFVREVLLIVKEKKLEGFICEDF